MRVTLQMVPDDPVRPFLYLSLSVPVAVSGLRLVTHDYSERVRIELVDARVALYGLGQARETLSKFELE